VWTYMEAGPIATDGRPYREAFRSPDQLIDAFPNWCLRRLHRNKNTALNPVSVCLRFAIVSSHRSPKWNRLRLPPSWGGFVLVMIIRHEREEHMMTKESLLSALDEPRRPCQSKMA
jgi:hypothetical protein